MCVWLSAAPAVANKHTGSSEYGLWGVIALGRRHHYNIKVWVGSHRRLCPAPVMGPALSCALRVCQPPMAITIETLAAVAAVSRRQTVASVDDIDEKKRD